MLTCDADANADAWLLLVLLLCSPAAAAAASGLKRVGSMDLSLAVGPAQHQQLQLVEPRGGGLDTSFGSLDGMEPAEAAWHGDHDFDALFASAGVSAPSAPPPAAAAAASPAAADLISMPSLPASAMLGTPARPRLGSSANQLTPLLWRLTHAMPAHGLRHPFGFLRLPSLSIPPLDSESEGDEGASSSSSAAAAGYAARVAHAALAFSFAGSGEEPQLPRLSVRRLMGCSTFCSVLLQAGETALQQQSAAPAASETPELQAAGAALLALLREQAGGDEAAAQQALRCGTARAAR